MNQFLIHISIKEINNKTIEEEKKEERISLTFSQIIIKKRIIIILSNYNFDRVEVLDIDLHIYNSLYTLPLLIEHKFYL